MRFDLRRSGIHIVFVLLMTIVSTSAWAAEELPDQFMLRLGGYHVRNADNLARLDMNNLPVGMYIDFNKDLGVDSQATVVRLDGLYRFSKHHGLGFAWYALKFTGSKNVGRDIQWGDLPPITIGTQVDSEIRFDVFKMNYQYSLFHNEQVELGALAGFHIMKTFVSVDAVGIGQAKSTGITAPLPVLGLFADYKFNPKTSLYYNYQVFSINYDNKLKGGMQDFLLGLEYRLYPHVAIGAAYNRYALDLQLVGNATTLYLSTSWNGGMLYGAVYF